MQQPAAPPLTQATGPPAVRTSPVTTRDCRVWHGAEAIPATILSAFAVGLPLRLLLPEDTRFMLVSVALTTVSATVVLVMPGIVTGPAAWVVRELAGLATPAPRPQPRPRLLAAGGMR